MALVHGVGYCVKVVVGLSCEMCEAIFSMNEVSICCFDAFRFMLGDVALDMCFVCVWDLGSLASTVDRPVFPKPPGQSCRPSCRYGVCFTW